MVACTEPVDGVHSTGEISTWEVLLKAEATPILYTYYRDTKYQLGNYCKHCIKNIIFLIHYIWM